MKFVEYLGTTICHTPACGWSSTAKQHTRFADVVRIGRFTKVICQECGSCKGLRTYDLPDHPADVVIPRHGRPKPKTLNAALGGMKL
jgi:hypothetical protein